MKPIEILRKMKEEGKRARCADGRGVASLYNRGCGDTSSGNLKDTVAMFREIRRKLEREPHGGFYLTSYEIPTDEQLDEFGK